MMTTTEQLAPLPHQILSIRNTPWTVWEALEEVIDNSFGPGKGNADNVWIVFTEDSIIVADDGVGFDDINRAFQIGSSNTYGHATDIGLYGVGLTHAAIWLADELTVKSVHNGTLHSHTVNWEDCWQNSVWPTRYEGDGKDGASPLPNILNGRVRTLIAFNGLRKERLQLETMMEHFGQDYAPGLKKGKAIHVAYVRGRLSNKRAPKFESVHPASPLIDDVRTISGTIDHGRSDVPSPLSWSGTVGRTHDPIKGRRRGALISYGFRVIECTQDAWTGYSPTTVYVEIDLAPGWKYALSDHKDRVVILRDELMKSIKAAIQQELEEDRRDSQYLHFRELSNLLQQSFRCLEPMFGTATGERLPGGKNERPPSPDEPAATVDEVDPLDLTDPVDGKVTSDADCDDKIPTRGGALQVDWQSKEEMGFRVVQASIGYDGIVAVAVNGEHPMIAKEAPQGGTPNQPFLVSVVAHGVASALAGETSEQVVKEFIAARPALGEFVEGIEIDCFEQAVYAWLMSNVIEPTPKKQGKPRKMAA